jgi:WD40-like Beta Propeller Repeat
LAFVSHGALWILDGDSQTLHAVPLPKGVVPLSPTFSPDGRWLAFTTGLAPLMQASLWLMPADGTVARKVTGIVLGDGFGWSPHADLYAVATGPLSKRAPFDQPTTVRLVSPNGRTRTLATAPAIVGAAWSPDGSSLAVSTINHDFVSTLSSYVISTGKQTMWPAAGGARDFVVPAGWWSQWGVVYTVIDNGAVPDGEGSFEDASLYVIANPDAAPQYLGKTLTNDSDGAPSGTPSGDFSFVSDSAGFPRTPWNGKQVVVCLGSSHACAPVPAPAGDVTEDPTWNPANSELAYVAALEMTTSEFLPSLVESWYGAHSLELFDVATAGTSSASAPGATVPVWANNGSNLLYEADDGLWLMTSGKPVEVASPLFAQASPASYYGEIDWAQQFGWSVGATTTAPCYVVCDPQL